MSLDPRSTSFQWLRVKVLVKCYLIALNQSLFWIIWIMKIVASSSESENNIREQASFMGRLRCTSWCDYTKFSAMPSSIECECYREIESVAKCIAKNASYWCISDDEQSKFVCLNKECCIHCSCYDEDGKRWSYKFTAT